MADPPAMRRAFLPAGESGPGHRDLRVLVADDNVINQQVATLLLAAMGHHADVVGDGDQAIAAVRAAPYDVVLMDLAMPATDGVSATRTIRQMGAEVHQPYIVALTAHAFPGDSESCREAGMDDYVTKPIDRAELARALGAGAARRNRSSLPAAGTAAVGSGPRPDFDPSVAARLAAEFGPEPLRRLAAIFRDEGNRLVATACAAVAAGDPEGAEQAAHSLKSSAANLGAVALSASCSELEATTRAGSLEGAATLTSAMVAQLASALRRLDEVAPAKP